MKKEVLVIIVAPSGAGKSSFLDRILQEEGRLVDTITYTTRKPRGIETEGNPYHFVSEKKFKDLEGKGFFIETAVVHGKFYGTPVDQIKKTWLLGQGAIMDVDVHGARVIKSKFPQAVTIFIKPPSIDELRRRIVARSGGTPPEDLEIRLETAHREMEVAHEFDYQVLNDDFEPSFQRFKKIIEEILNTN